MGVQARISVVTLGVADVPRARDFYQALGWPLSGAPEDGVADRPVGKIMARWPMPDLVLIDGGLAQVNTARRVLLRAGIKVPIIGIAKGPKRDRNDVIGLVPKGVQKTTLIKVRDEAHRFAISYHRALRRVRAFH